ncbi:KxYKxGKxW signal peptide domain-containing protein [Secundilactobacillus yichangensis]|uniref:KxYKxGKxW signal peptide domain-containing protein n=1 Tax=Secundilactobacillus yichangensis TaxID=2799580 RepID=UPI0019443238|nr:KxYKxGKxW signal peptide domain-containing protein [Secundilactobacillus yichangensis]
MGKNNLKSPFIESKHVVRLYKKGKSWVSLGLTFATLAGLSLAAGTTANAAEATTSNTATAVSEQAPAAKSNSAALPAQTNQQSSGNASQEKAPATDSSANTEASTSTQQSAVKTPEVKSAVDATAAPTDDPATAGLIVTTQDGKGNYSTDKSYTDGNHQIDVTGQSVKDHFTSGGSNRKTSTPTTPKVNSDGDTYQLTDPSDPNYTESGIVAANEAIDFTSDFSLKATVNINWDPSMINHQTNPFGKLGGDGMAINFQPVSTDDALTKGGPGRQLGLVPNADPTNGTISYNISTNPNGLSPRHAPHNDTWIIYQSNANAERDINDPYPDSDVTSIYSGIVDTHEKLPATNSTGGMTYTFETNYSVANHQLVTNIIDSTGQTVKTYTTTIKVPDQTDEASQNFVLGVTSSTADSKAKYSVTINDFKYTPANAKLNITNNLNSPLATQSGIVGRPGQVLAFYDGTTAPTNADKAYKAPVIQGYHLENTQYITLAATGTNTVKLMYVPDKQSLNVQFVDQNGKQLGNIVSVGGESDGSVDLKTAFDAQQSLINAGYTLKEGNNNGLANVPKTFNQYGKVPTYKVVLSKINNVPADLTMIPVGPDGKTPISNTHSTTVTKVPGTSVNVPTIPGYTPTVTTVKVPTPVLKLTNDGKVPTPDKRGATVNVTYTPNDQTIIVNFIDGSGKSLGTTSLTGKTDGPVDYSDAFAKEQSIINNYYTPKDGLFNGLAGAPATFSAHPQVINVQLTKINNVKVTATLVPVDGNGNPIPNTTPTTVQNYPGTLVPVPEIPGYTPLENTVAVPGGRGDNKVPVVYKQNPVTNDTTGEPAVATATPTPTTPTAETPQPAETTPAPTTQAQPSEGTATTQPTVQPANGQATGETTVAPQQLGTAEAPAKTGKTQATTAGTASQTTVTQKAASQQPAQKASAQLPQADEHSDQATATSFLGLMMLSLLGGLGLRKKRSDNQ